MLYLRSCCAVISKISVFVLLNIFVLKNTVLMIVTTHVHYVLVDEHNAYGYVHKNNKTLSVFCRSLPWWFRWFSTRISEKKTKDWRLDLDKSSNFNLIRANRLCSTCVSEMQNFKSTMGKKCQRMRRGVRLAFCDLFMFEDRQLTFYLLMPMLWVMCDEARKSDSPISSCLCFTVTGVIWIYFCMFDHWEFKKKENHKFYMFFWDIVIGPFSLA